MTEKITFTGSSFQTYVFEKHPIGAPFPPLGACYVFIQQMFPQSPIYIGETGDLSDRFENHHKLPCIRSEGATHICIYVTGMERLDNRQAVESDLLGRYNPPCNQ